MKYLLILSFFFIGCGDETSTPSKSTYTLFYDKDYTSISGVVLLDAGSIPKNHIVRMTNFLPVIEGCRVDFTTTTITPDSLFFTAFDTKKSLSMDINLTSPCYTTTLRLKADYVDSSVLDDRNVTYTTEKTYIFEIEKPSQITQ